MRRRLWMGASAVLAALVGCGDKDSDTEGPVAEYGMPMAHYELSGKVLAAGTEDGIEGMEVEFAYEHTTATDADGAWEISADAMTCYDSCQVTARDVDGAENGEWEEATVTFEPTQVELGSGGWDDGDWEATDVDIEVTPLLDS